MKFNKKIISAIVAIACIVSTGFFTQGCDNEEVSTASQVDNLVASEEFQAVLANIETFGHKMKVSYSNLSVSDKEKYDNLKDEADPVKRLERMSEILNIDFNAEFSNIQSSLTPIRNDIKNISKKDLLASIKKTSISRNQGLVPRLRSSGEYDGWCVAGCALSMTLAMIVCDALGSPAAWIACAALATDLYLSCCENCQE
ncbi:hypothetical protein [Viscerimonas tarda]